jgi:hypothetical protein
MELGETKEQLLYSQICHQSEAQSRRTFQRGLEVHRQTHFQLAKNYKSMYEECKQEKASLQKDLQIAEELIGSQKQLIELYQRQHQQQQQQQQQPATHYVQGGPLLSQYNDPNHSCQYSPTSLCTCQYSSYPSPGNDKFIDPVGIHPLNDLNYNMFPAEHPYDTESVIPPPVAESENQKTDMSIPSMLLPPSIECGTEPVVSTPVAGFEYQTPNLSILHPISAERDVPGPTHNKTEEMKRGLEDEVVKPRKKTKR